MMFLAGSDHVQPCKVNEKFEVTYGFLRPIFEDYHISFPDINDNCKVTVFNHTIIEEHAKFVWPDAVCSIGMYSYINSKPFHGLYIGRYCSIAKGLQTFIGKHFTDWVSTSPAFYNRAYVDIDCDLSWEERSATCIVIGHDVWVGQDVTIANSCQIGRGAIIGANSVVLDDVAPYAVVAGNPARFIRWRFPKDVIAGLEKISFWQYDAVQLRGRHMDSPRKFIASMLQSPPPPGNIRRADLGQLIKAMS